jgi:hypothetical protein
MFCCYLEMVSPPTTPGTVAMTTSLTREMDLVPQETDLDHLFESSESDNDDAVSGFFFQFAKVR